MTVGAWLWLEMRWFTAPEGGRVSGRPVGPRYFATAALATESGTVETREQHSIELVLSHGGDSAHARFLVPATAPATVEPGGILLIHEGPRVVARAKVVSSYTEITLRRNRGWPWPEDSWGLTPMFGEDGWCHSCGVPSRTQIGSVVLLRSGLTVTGGWVPNWRFDVYCLARPIAQEAAARFGIGLRPVTTPSGQPLEADQIVIPTSMHAWFDPADLERVIRPVHPEVAETCPECNITRWMPVGMDVLPPPSPEVLAARPPVIASPEWFGSGKQSFSQILWRQDLAEFLLAASPKDFRLGE